MTLRTWAEWQAQREERQEAWCREAPKLGRELRRQRLNAGWTQVQLAAAIGASAQWVGWLETGRASERAGREWLERAMAAATAEAARFTAQLRRPWDWQRVASQAMTQAPEGGAAWPAKDAAG